MKFEKSSYRNTHAIESNNVLLCSVTGRVLAVFYNDYDLDDLMSVIDQVEDSPQYETVDCGKDGTFKQCKVCKGVVRIK